MSRHAPVVAWTMVAVALALTTVTAVLLWANRDTLPSSEVGDVLAPFLALGSCVIGAVVAAHRPGNRVGWLLLALGTFQVLMGTAQEYAVWAVRGGYTTLPSRVLALSTFSGLILAAAAILFPKGRLPSRRWAVATWALVALGTVGIATSPFVELRPAFRDPGLAYTVTSPGDSGLTEGEIVEGAELRAANGRLSASEEPAQGEAWLGPALVAGAPVEGVLLGPYFVVFLPILAAAGIRLVLLGFRSSGETRLQLRWLAYVIAVALTLVALSALEIPYVENLNIVAGIVLALGVPAAVAVAILRYRLYEIDRVVSRTVGYGLVVGLLAALYVLVVVGIPTLLPAAEDSQLLVAGATLAAFFLFGPLRRRVLRIVDRRFYRSRYDAQQIVEAFSARLRDEVDVEALTADWVSVVQGTVQPSSVSVWLRSRPEDAFLAPSSSDAP